MLDQCLQHFRLPPTAAVYVGDSDTDHQAALAAGIPFIGSARRAGGIAPALRQLPRPRARGNGQKLLASKSQNRLGSDRLLPCFAHPSITIPPSTGMHCPVTIFESSDASHTAVPVRSSGSSGV